MNRKNYTILAMVLPTVFMLSILSNMVGILSGDTTLRDSVFVYVAYGLALFSALVAKRSTFPVISFIGIITFAGAALISRYAEISTYKGLVISAYSVGIGSMICYLEVRNAINFEDAIVVYQTIHALCKKLAKWPDYKILLFVRQLSNPSFFSKFLDLILSENNEEEKKK